MPNSLNPVHGRLLALLYGLSGAVALCYEVLWSKMLNLAFGVSIFGITVTVAAFMLGLGLGSLFGLRWVANIRHPLRLFAMLEGGVALFAMGFTYILQIGTALTERWTLGFPVESWFVMQGGFLILILLLPTVAMGMGFPIVLRIMHKTEGSLGRLYGINTLGGAMGALLSLLLLPWLGVNAALSITALLGLSIAVLAFWLSGKISTPYNTKTPPTRRASAAALFPWLCYAGMGAAALMLEIGWVRLYGLVFLRTEYLLAIILAIYLGGIGLGSLCVRRFPTQSLLNVFPTLVLIFVLLGLWAFPFITQWMQAQTFASLFEAMWAQGTAVALMTLPVTLILGAWLPLIVKTASQNNQQTGAEWYGVNAIGASAGVCLAGFVLLPLIGTSATIIIAGSVLCLLGSYWASIKTTYGTWIALPLLLLLSWWHSMGALPPAHRLVPSLTKETVELYRYEDAVSITHVVEQADGQRLLLTDLQRMDASTSPAAVQTQMNQARLPLLLKPEAQSILFLGLGTGITAAGSITTQGNNLQRTAVELSRGAIIAAQRWFIPANRQIMQSMKVVHDDARRFLRRDKGHYDVIVGDVFHPDRVGRSTLLSVEQFERAKKRLTTQGIFVQWLALNQFDVNALKIVLRSFKRVFPDARLFIDGFRLAMVSSSSAPSSTMQQHKRHTKEEIWTWLGRYWGKIDSKVLGHGAIESEWRPRIEYHLSSLRYQQGNHLADTLDWLLRLRPPLDVATQQLGLSDNDADKSMLEATYAATHLVYRSWLYDMRGQMPQAQRLLRFAYQANPNDPWIRSTLADRMLASLSSATQRKLNKRQGLLRILSIDPNNTEALRALWHYERLQGHAQLAVQYRQHLQDLSPLDREVRRYDAANPIDF